MGAVAFGVRHHHTPVKSEEPIKDGWEALQELSGIDLADDRDGSPAGRPMAGSGSGLVDCRDLVDVFLSHGADL